MTNDAGAKRASVGGPSATRSRSTHRRADQVGVAVVGVEVPDRGFRDREIVDSLADDGRAKQRAEPDSAVAHRGVRRADENEFLDVDLRAALAA